MGVFVCFGQAESQVQRKLDAKAAREKAARDAKAREIQKIARAQLAKKEVRVEW